MINPITEELIPFFSPQLQVWKDHFAWNEDASEIMGLTDIGRVTIEALKMNRLQLVRVRKMWFKLGEHPPTLTSPTSNPFTILSSQDPAQ